MSGLGSWVQSQWVDRQRRLWREHDAKLAEVWREESLADSAGVAGQADVGVPTEAGSAADVIVLPDTQASRGGSRIGS
ncbi:MAG: hypothetical protein ACRDV3_15275 [Acidothermaceae bacterium]